METPSGQQPGHAADAVHISRRYDQELEQLRERILAMGGNLVGMIKETMRALIERDSDAARRMIEYDHEINRQEVMIDELSLNIIALRQPAASDLRFITLALKVSTDLERIGDLCVNIAERTLELNEEPQLKPYIDLPKMAEAAEGMIVDALEAFLRGDAELAAAVTRRDDYIDQLNSQIFRELLTFMMEEPKTITRATRLIFVGKNLERIADHATNIAEMVIFMVKGKDIRHMGDGRA
ncbi:MAG TPA: phosphate signaling complex protein PhoU [bacterium]